MADNPLPPPPNLKTEDIKAGKRFVIMPGDVIITEPEEEDGRRP